MNRQSHKNDLDKTRRYEKLVTAHSDWLFRYAYWLSGNRQEAEDLVQETSLRAWRFLDSLQDDAAAKSWLTTILRRENARKYARKRLEYSDVEVGELADQHTDMDTRPETIQSTMQYYRHSAVQSQVQITAATRGIHLHSGIAACIWTLSKSVSSINLWT